MVDIKKALAFIKNNAVETPTSTRQGQEYIIPAEVVKAIQEQIKENNGSFAIDRAKFNEQFGWSAKSLKALYLQKKLNKQYPVDGEGMEWHVGLISKRELYKFEIRETKVKEEE